MSNPKYNWDEPNQLNNIPFEEEDVKLFSDLLNNREEQAERGSIAKMEVGQILTGNIIELHDDFVVVDVGLKSEGMVSRDEFEGEDELKIGAATDVFLERAEGEDGQIVLSRVRAREMQRWEHVKEHCPEGSLIKGRITRRVKGGLMVDIGMEAFLPGSQIDNRRIKEVDHFLGKEFEFKIIKINLERKNVVVSRRALLEEERSSKKAQILEQIEPGQIRQGVIKNITDFGVFIDLDGIDGLLHITDMTWNRIKHPSEVVNLGDDLEIVILSVDKEKGRVALGRKQMEPNPWKEIANELPPGTRLKGKITNLVPYGAFISIREGFEGLIHISDLSWNNNISHPSEVLTKGEEVEAVVLSVQENEGKISLSIKETQANPWKKALEKYPVGSTVESTVRNLTNYGAFVTLEPGIDGLIHISDINWVRRISHPSEVLSKGDRLQAMVLSNDPTSQKITLGLKQLDSNNPWSSIKETISPGSVVKGKVTKITAFGAFLEMEDTQIEGLVHVSEISNGPLGRIEDHIQVGDEVQAKVIKIDLEHSKISLSIKACILDQDQKDQDEIQIDE